MPDVIGIFILWISKDGDGMNLIQIIKGLLLSLVLTLLFEMLVALIAKVRDKKDLFLVVLVNVITNPAVVFMYYVTVLFAGLCKYPIILILEVCAIIIEAMIYRKYAKTIHHPLIFSIVANLISYGSGLILTNINLGGIL